MVRNRGPSRRASSYVRERAAAEGSATTRLKHALAARGLSPRKRFGQNFLIREEIAERIVEHCHLREDDVVVEIGPGAGALTPMIARSVRHVIAVEMDRGLAELLREELAETPRVEIVEGDFLEFDLAAAAAAHGVVQHEYAARLAAAAGTPEYGSITLFARYHALMEPLMTVRSGAFWPRPDVDSMLVRFFLREHPPVEAPEALLFRIIRASFQQRRKQLMNTLQNALGLPGDAVERLGRQAGIALTRRGETLTLDEFARLARAAVDRGVDA